MLDVESELVRFGRWLDDQIDGQLAPAPLVDEGARVGERSTRLVLLAVAAALVVIAGLVALGHRERSAPDADQSTSLVPSSVAVAVLTTISALETSPSTVAAATTVNPLHLVPPDPSTIVGLGGVARRVSDGGLAVLAGRPAADGYTDVWWIGVGRLPGPVDPNEAQPEGRRAFGDAAVINEHGTTVVFRAAPHTETLSTPCPPAAALCSATPTLRTLIDATVIDDVGHVTWTLPEGMVEIARTTREIQAEPMVSTNDGLDIIVDHQLTTADFLAATVSDVRRTTVRGHEGWIAAIDPLGLSGGRRASVMWEERPGIVVAVSGATTDERLIGFAESLRVVDQAEWSRLVTDVAAKTPPPGYGVVVGDTLAGIAEKLGVSLQDLLTANPDIDPDKFLVVGQRVRIPTGP